MKNSVYVLYDAKQGNNPEPKFAFHASNLKEAKSLAIRWARYHSMDPRDFGVEENPYYRESGAYMHDEYMDHPGRAKMILFWQFQTVDSPRALMIEGHLFQGKVPPPSEIRKLLHQVSFHFNEDFELRDDVTSPGPNIRAAYDLGIVSKSGSLIVASFQV